jgi:hypothetical protein
MHKVNNHPMGENLPNLVTLIGSFRCCAKASGSQLNTMLQKWQIRLQYIPCLICFTVSDNS